MHLSQPMKSSKQRKAEIQSARASRRSRVAAIAEQVRQERAAREQAGRMKAEVAVNPANLRPTNSYGTPDFVKRGFYVDTAFTCKGCGAIQTWTATQQKWWYESAKGDVWTVAVMCKPCRAKERARKAQARTVHLDGIARRNRRSG